MRITVLTLFPEMYESFLSTSIIGRALKRELVTVDFVQIRDFALDKFKHVDDSPFGGGMGQVMKCQPVLDALHSVKRFVPVFQQAPLHQEAHQPLIYPHYC